jgi:hypothetical protein
VWRRRTHTRNEGVVFVGLRRVSNMQTRPSVELENDRFCATGGGRGLSLRARQARVPGEIRQRHQAKGRSEAMGYLV